MIGSWLGRSEGALGWVGGHPVGVGRGTRSEMEKVLEQMKFRGVGSSLGTSKPK